jgi:hypothetical protein
VSSSANVLGRPGIAVGAARISQNQHLSHGAKMLSNFPCSWYHVTDGPNILATALNISEDSARYLLTQLAARGTITVTGKAKS